MRQYTIWFGETESSMIKSFISSDDDGELLDRATQIASGFGRPGNVWEVRNDDGKVIHRIKIEMVYTVNPDD